MYLTHVESVFNNSVNTATHQAPNELLYGTTVWLFPNMDLLIDTSDPTVAEYLEKFKNELMTPLQLPRIIC